MVDPFDPRLTASRLDCSIGTNSNTEVEDEDFEVGYKNIIQSTVKILKICPPEKLAVITLKFEQCGLTIE